MTRRLKRRQFLKLAATAGVAVSAPLVFPSRVGAEPYEGPCFAIFNAQGGWDTTMLCDPRGATDLNDHYDPSQIITRGAHRFAPTAGHVIEPSADTMTNEDFFAKYGSELLVINGIDTSVNNHTPCERYTATGKLNSTEFPTFAALVGAAKAPDAALSFMTFGGYSGTGNIIAATRVPYANSLRRLGDVDVRDNAPSAEAEAMISEALGEVARAGHSLPKLARARSFLYAAQTGAQDLSRAVPFIPDRAPEDNMKKQADIALAGFASGLAVSANLEMGRFDSHDSNDSDQLRFLPRLLSAVDYFLERAEELGIRDRVVVVVQSEMGRTPWYNDTRGKDHWSVNSQLILGPGITGNRVVGATRYDEEAGNDLAPE